VNGTAPDIQVVRPFSQAIELTKTILFRPFDLTKWCVIGFAAWLAHIGGGGGGNVPSNWRTSTRNNPAFDGLRDTLHQTPTSMIIIGVVVLGVFILGLIVLFAWLRARGRLMFTDCVVRNRAAIKEPWREFRSLGNSLFVFSLLVILAFLVAGVVLALPLIALFGRGHHHTANPLAIVIIVVWAGVIFVASIVWALINHLMVPIMYRRRCRAPEAFRAAIGLISTYPGEITIYCLFWILLFIATVFIACVTTCLTCCIAAIPYVGTVILLPVYVCWCGFELLFLRQFGSDYDAWFGLPIVQAGVTAPGDSSGSSPPATTESPAPPPPPPVSPPEPPPINPPEPPLAPS
jgi:hypothetical protein